VPWKGGGSQPPVAPDPPPLITCMVFNTCCSSEGGRGWRKELFHEDWGSLIPVRGIITTFLLDIRLVFCAVIAIDGFDQKFWDPSSTVSSKFSWFGADLEPAHHHELDIINAFQLGFQSDLSASVEADGMVSTCWDPGVAGGFGFMELSGSSTVFHWDPGSLEGLQPSGFLRFRTDFALVCHAVIDGIQQR
jgi:hypothetical protein